MGVVTSALLSTRVNIPTGLKASIRFATATSASKIKWVVFELSGLLGDIKFAIIRTGQETAWKLVPYWSVTCGLMPLVSEIKGRHSNELDRRKEKKLNWKYRRK